MARYEKPKDPRKSDLKQTRERRLRSDTFDWVPVIGLLLGLIVTAAAILIGWQVFRSTMLPEPLVVALPSPTIIILTAPPTQVPTATPRAPTPTAIATLTPEPTPDLSLAPDKVTVGYYAAVANTAGIGVRVRGGPSTANAGIMVADEGLVFQVVGGPSEGSGFTWWQIQIDEETQGWVASDFLVPAGKPAADAVAPTTEENEP